nr:PREDICTED: ubiquitin-like-conjugating enzyme ATG10 [Lepisosteus oculatus]
MSGELEKARDLYLEEAAFRLFCKQLVLHSQALGDGWVWEDMKESEDGYMKKTLLKAGPVSAPSRDCGQRSPRDEPAELELEAQTPVEEEPGEGDTENAIVKTTEVIRYEYHVVYSCSYRVPVLYFRASTLEGRPLGLEEIWAGVHEHYRERLSGHFLLAHYDISLQHLAGAGAGDADMPRKLVTVHGLSLLGDLSVTGNVHLVNLKSCTLFSQQKISHGVVGCEEHPLLGQAFFALHPCRTQEFMSPIVTAAKGENRSLNYIAAWLSVVGPVVGLSLPLSYATAAWPSPAAPD